MTWGTITSQGLLVHDGSTEYSLFSCEVTEENKRAVDQAVVKGPSLPAEGQEACVYYQGEPVFAGVLVKKNKKNLQEGIIYSYGHILQAKKYNRVWVDKSPEDIVSDVVSDAGFVFASSDVSGFTLSKYVARDRKGIDIIRDMCDLLDWDFRTDVNKNAWFEPKAKHDDGSLTVGVNCRLKGKWLVDVTRIMNDIHLVGGEQVFRTVESFTGDGSTVFTVSYKPENVKVTVDGVEKEPDTPNQDHDYSVDDENKTITFHSPPANGASVLVEYSYRVPVSVQGKNEESVNGYGVHSGVLRKPFITTMTEARTQLQKYLSMYNDPFRKGVLRIPFTVSYKPGHTVTVVDDANGVNESMIIYQVKRKVPGWVEVTVGSNDFNLADWAHETEERIKKLEDRMQNVDLVQNYLQFSHSVDVNLVSNGSVRGKWVVKTRAGAANSSVWDNEYSFYDSFSKNHFSDTELSFWAYSDDPSLEVSPNPNSPYGIHFINLDDTNPHHGYVKWTMGHNASFKYYTVGATCQVSWKNLDSSFTEQDISSWSWTTFNISRIAYWDPNLAGFVVKFTVPPGDELYLTDLYGEGAVWDEDNRTTWTVFEEVAE